jgi:tRNA threonylcarbamoyladenosine biosynthesis protein TsaB
MTILCLDTATTTARVAIIDNTGTGVVIAAREATAARHSSNVLRLCDEVLVAAGVSPAALSAIACGAGPGSFTGLRVGLAVAKGLAMPTGVPLVLVSSLAAMALDILSDDAGDGVLAAPCLDAGKGEVHVGLYRRDAAELVVEVAAPLLLSPADLPSRVAAGSPTATIILAGSGADRYAETLDAILPATWRRLPVSGPTAGAIGRLGRRQLQQGGAADLGRAVPFYGRGPDITVKKPRQK